MFYKYEMYYRDFLPKMLSANPAQLPISLVNSIMQSPVKKSSDFMDLEFRKITNESHCPTVNITFIYQNVLPYARLGNRLELGVSICFSVV